MRPFFTSRPLAEYRELMRPRGIYQNACPPASIMNRIAGLMRIWEANDRARWEALGRPGYFLSGREFEHSLRDLTHSKARRN